jgi:hypothetical protein
MNNWAASTGSIDIKKSMLETLNKMESLQRGVQFNVIHMTQPAWDFIKPHVVNPHPMQIGLMLYGFPLKVFPTIVELVHEPQFQYELVLAIDFADNKLVQLDLTAIRNLASQYSLTNKPT